jgi:hypothetical protein
MSSGYSTGVAGARCGSRISDDRESFVFATAPRRRIEPLRHLDEPGSKIAASHFAIRDGELHSRVKTIQQKLARLDEAFLYSESIDLTSYSRLRDKRREELTLAKIERHTEAVEELPGGNRLRRKSVQSNRRNGATFQLLGAESEW